MQAVQLHSFGNSAVLKLEDVPQPAAGVGEQDPRQQSGRGSARLCDELSPAWFWRHKPDDHADSAGGGAAVVALESSCGMCRQTRCKSTPG